MNKKPLACAILAFSLVQGAQASNEQAAPLPDNDSTYLGFGIGSVIGAIIAGPPGAAVGAAIGGTIGWSEGETEVLNEKLQASAEALKEKEITLRRNESELKKANQKLANLSRSNALQASRIADLIAQNATPSSPSQERFLQSVAEHYAQQIHFRKGEFKLPDDAEKRLDSLSELLTDNPLLSVSLKAYADQTGPESFNKQLAQARADTIRDHLFNRGVQPDQVSVEAFGELGASVQLGDSSNYVLDRRVSIELDINAPEDLSVVSAGEMIQ